MAQLANFVALGLDPFELVIFPRKSVMSKRTVSRRFIGVWLAVCLVWGGGVSSTCAADVGRESDLIGRRIADFVLPDPAGKQIAPSDFPEARARVVVFLGTECPISNAYAPDLVAFQERFRDRGVQVIAINSLLTDTADEIARHATEHGFNFPVLVDSSQVVADLLEAKRIPQVYLLDYRNTLRYVGRIDDRVGFDHQNDSARRSDLEEAVEELLDGKAVSVPHTPVDGCRITRRSRVGKSPPTFSADVAGILHKRCAGCHQADTAAPFSLLTYEDARDRADMIREVVAQRRMPPWDADSRHGEFENDLRLPQRELDTLLAWIDTGAELGDATQVPAPPEFASGWQIPQPDLVFQLPEPYEIPAKGTVQYQYFVVPTNLEQDVWVQASEEIGRAHV